MLRSILRPRCSRERTVPSEQPIVSAISREVIGTVPAEHKEAALALGATRWEMIRMAVLPYARPGITGGAG